MNKVAAESLLNQALNTTTAKFREGQWEAIDALVNYRKKLLVIQRTGWGKSSVYFISTRILRDRGLGPTIIVSPLLALMRNQIEAAERLGIHALTVNSTNSEKWPELTKQILSNQADCILISPERLANEEFVTSVLQPIASRVGLVVVDEAHCISDWGHDFRPDYRRILNILQQMPPNMPVLGTTATANNRVINDIVEQLGNIEVQRGSLIRESLSLQNIVLSDQASRLAWLATNIPHLPGTGIIYVLTKRDAEQVAGWLRENNILALAYYSDVKHEQCQDSNSYRQALEEALLNNRLKVLVATTALGMGYDKPDLSFVIHYQAPNSIISYYQQVGRAGRGIAQSYGFLLLGQEDADVHAYFRRSAFPSQEQIKALLFALEQTDGMSVPNLQKTLNLSHGQIEKTLKFLSVQNPATVIKHGSQWRRTPVKLKLDQERILHLTEQREHEWNEVQTYIQSSTCLMQFLRDVLDDPATEPCGKCTKCLEVDILPIYNSPKLSLEATRYLKQSEFPLEPRKQIPHNAFTKYYISGILRKEWQANEGRILSCWGDSGWGSMVEDGKHSGYFSDALVEAVADMILNRWQPNPAPQWLTCVPSLRHTKLVPDFAKRLALRLNLPFIEAIRKVEQNQPQKLQQNSYHQCHNLDGAFVIAKNIPSKPVFLIDDVIDSGWTVTVLTVLLRQQGSGEVFPLALASTSTGD